MKIFCVGIGGIGLSGVAQLLKAQKHDVLGSDISPNEITKRLIESGISVFSQHKENHIDSSIDLLIYSEAVSEINPEREKARVLGIPQISYAKALGNITKGKKVIAIAGTHGKTTVTGMVANILLEAKDDPTIIIGSTLDRLGGLNFRLGSSELFLAEACEYRDNFHFLNPSILLINTLEPDHLDYFKTPEGYYASFQKFAEKMNETGVLIMNISDAKKLDLSKVRAKKVLLYDQENEKHFDLLIPGKHNQKNACSAEAIGAELGISKDVIDTGLRSFTGTGRRFQFKGFINGAMVYDDYGHHPTEIVATLQGAREWSPEKHIIVVFQPHQYSRTRYFFNDFIHSFHQADEVWITDIYKARDTSEDIESVSAQKLAAAISKPVTSYISLDSIPQKIQETANANTIFLIMGAGNISNIFQHLLFDQS